MRGIAAKAIILLLALIIAVVLIAPRVELAPAAPRLEWAACLLVVFMSWLASAFACVALSRVHGLGLAAFRSGPPLLLFAKCPPVSSDAPPLSFRC